MKKPKTAAHKAALSKAKKGVPVPALWKAVMQFTKDGQLIAEYQSVKEAKQATHVGHIDEVCRGNRPFAGGYIWRFKDKQTINEGEE